VNKEGLTRSLGAASVVLSLLFVGYQIRQSTAVARTAAFHSFMADRSALLDLIATDPVLTPLIARMTAGELAESFDDVERFRLQVYLTRSIRSWEGLFAAVREGVLDQGALAVVAEGGGYDNDFFRSVWPALRGRFSPDFVQFFEGLPWNTGS
jgi:hypothetical protein